MCIGCNNEDKRREKSYLELKAKAKQYAVETKKLTAIYKKKDGSLDFKLHEDIGADWTVIVEIVSNMSNSPDDPIP